MNPAWKLRELALATLLTVLLQGCALSGGPLEGVVLDKGSNQPLAGVIVVARWYGDWTRFVHASSTACYHVETTRTDANGRYHIRRWTREFRMDDLRMSSDGYAITLYKPDYVDMGGGKTGTAHMQRFVGTRGEYFDKVLDQNQWLCEQAGESSNQLYRVFKAAADDARSKAVNAQQLSTVMFFERMTRDSLVNREKPKGYAGDVLVNVDPKDNLSTEE